MQGNLLSTSSDPSPNSLWYVVGTIAATLMGAILKTFVDLVGRRDSFQEKWRADMIVQLRELRGWNEQQQAQLNANVERMTHLENSVSGEQQLRHELRNQLNNEKLAHEILKHDYAELKAKYEDCKAKHDALCAERSVGDKPKGT